MEDVAYQLPTKDYALIIEDIDTMWDVAKRQVAEDDEDEPPPIPLMGEGARTDPVLHKMLNFLDGFYTPEGLVVLITTNKLESLDPALLRRGRVDLLLEVGKLEFSEMREMFLTFYGDSGEVDSLKGTYKPTVGATLQEIFANNTKDRAIELLKGI